MYLDKIIIGIEKKYNIETGYYYGLKKEGIIKKEFIEKRQILISPMLIDNR